MKKLFSVFINFILSFYKIDDNKILFQSGRNKVDCNPYAIYKYIKENCPDDFKCVWLVERDTDTSMLDKNDFYYYRTFKGMVAQATSKYWIRSQSLGGVVKKKKKQVYIQTWHGAGDFKKCEYDCLPEEERPNEVINSAKDWDYLVTTDKYNEKSMLSSTGYKKPTFLIGNAESDLIVNSSSEDVKRVKKEIGIDDEKKVIMYAPTFRDTDLNKENINVPIFKLGELDDYIVLLRLHPLISKKIENMKLPKNFINVGSYPNIIYLYLVTDILITDYSSIVFPYMILKKNLIMYPYDFDDYVKLRGGFYLDYKNDLPGEIVYNEEELIDTVKNINNIRSKFEEKIKTFNEKYNNYNDGHVCERFVKLLKEGKFK